MESLKQSLVPKTSLQIFSLPQPLHLVVPADQPLYNVNTHIYYSQTGLIEIDDVCSPFRLNLVSMGGGWVVCRL